MNRFQTGLLLCALSALLNVDGLISLFQTDGPPVFVGVASIVLALATLLGVALAARAGGGPGVPLIVGGRVLSALGLSLPAFFLDAPAWVFATAGAGIVLTAVGVPLLWTGRRSAVEA